VSDLTLISFIPLCTAATIDLLGRLILGCLLTAFIYSNRATFLNFCLRSDISIITIIVSNLRIDNIILRDIIVVGLNNILSLRDKICFEGFEGFMWILSDIFSSLVVFNIVGLVSGEDHESYAV